jgi:hypothetical protein
MTKQEKIEMHIANCKCCLLASAMKTCPLCRFNIGLPTMIEEIIAEEMTEAAMDTDSVGKNYIKTPQQMKDNEEVIRIVSMLAREGYFIDTEHKDEWVAFVHDCPEKCETGETQLEAVEKIATLLITKRKNPLF